MSGFEGQDLSAGELGLQPKIQVEQKLVPVRVGERTMNVSMKIYRPEREITAQYANIYCQGMSYSVSGPLNKIELAQAEKAQKNGEVWVAVGLEGSVLEGHESGSPNLNADAKFVLRALEQEQIDLLKAVNICGHSEGAAMAVALAGAIDELQKSRLSGGELPQNKLRLFSLTGVIDLNDWMRGYNLILNALREKVSTEIINMVDYYNRVVGKMPDIKSIRDVIPLMMEVRNLKKKNATAGQLPVEEARSDDMGLLRRRFADQHLFDIIRHMSKLEHRNPVCNRLGENWIVEMKVPRADLIYPWTLVRGTIEKVKRDMEVLHQEGIPHRVGTDVAKIRERISSEVGGRSNALMRGMQWLFPGAQRVEVEVMGEEGELCSLVGGVSANMVGKHMGMEIAPEKFLE